MKYYVTQYVNGKGQTRWVVESSDRLFAPKWFRSKKRAFRYAKKRNENIWRLA